jgi:uncharacterized cupin superfamily protein
VSEPTNVFEVEPSYRDENPPAYRRGDVELAPLIGGALLGASVYELRLGVSTFPYHYEYGNEEWLLVLAGRPTLRTPEGERELQPGDVACFPEGSAGAHKVTNAGTETARVMILSTKNRTAVAVYPDSDRIGIWTANPGDNVMVRRSSNVEYFDGEV